MEGLTRCTTVFHVSKTLSEFTILPSECWREAERQRQGGGGDGRVGPTHLKERERGNDRLIYSKSEEWVNQTLMAFGSASRSLSPFNLAPLTQSFLVCSRLTSHTSVSPRLCQKYTFRWSLTSTSLPFFWQSNLRPSLYSTQIKVLFMLSGIK